VAAAVLPDTLHSTLLYDGSILSWAAVSLFRELQLEIALVGCYSLAQNSNNLICNNPLNFIHTVYQ